MHHEIRSRLYRPNDNNTYTAIISPMCVNVYIDIGLQWRRKLQAKQNLYLPCINENVVYKPLFLQPTFLQSAKTAVVGCCLVYFLFSVIGNQGPRFKLKHATVSAHVYAFVSATFGLYTYDHLSVHGRVTSSNITPCVPLIVTILKSGIMKSAIRHSLSAVSSFTSVCLSHSIPCYKRKTRSKTAANIFVWPTNFFLSDYRAIEEHAYTCVHHWNACRVIVLLQVLLTSTFLVPCAT